MKSNNILRVTVLLAAFLVVHGQEESQCRGVDLHLAENQRKDISDCMKESEIETIWRIPAEKQGLSEDGKLIQSKVIDLIEFLIRPEEAKAPLKDGVNECFVAFGDQVENKKMEDNSCMAFLGVGQCVHDVFLDVCFED